MTHGALSGERGRAFGMCSTAGCHQLAPLLCPPDRYRDVSWLTKERRWPPALITSLQAFLQLKSI
jgi:hypothetical protein